jgi:DNA repair protein RadC
MSASSKKPKFPKDMVGEVQATYQTGKLFPKVKIINSKLLADEARKRWPVDVEYREAFVVIYGDRANGVLGHAVISLGGVASTVVDPKIVFQHGLLCNASGMFLVHNHPSDNPKPSESDIELTRKLKQLGQMMDMIVLDHVILTSEGYYSFADEGIL